VQFRIFFRMAADMKYFFAFHDLRNPMLLHDCLIAYNKEEATIGV
jgi:hypothetical protein